MDDGGFYLVLLILRFISFQQNIKIFLLYFVPNSTIFRFEYKVNKNELL